MESNTENILRIENDLLLSESSDVVQAVLTQKVMYTKLIICKATTLFDETFMQSEAYKLLLKKLGESVVSFAMAQMAFGLRFDASCFKNLREINIHNIYQIPLKMFQDNESLEKITLNDKVINIKLATYEIDKRFTDVLILCKSLKKLIFDCDIPLAAEVVNEMFADICFNILGMDEIIIDCVPLPCWTDYANYYWIIERIEMEFITNDDSRKLVIKPLKLRDELKDGHEICEEDCDLDHQVFKCESVTDFHFKSFFKHHIRNKCQAYYISCVKSVPSITELNIQLNINEKTLHLISKNLKCISAFYLSFGTRIKRWPLFSNIKSARITCSTSTLDNFERFVQSVPNLKSLQVEMLNGITDDECLQAISKQLRNIEYLNVKCGSSRLTATGLNMIENNLKKLNDLTMNCTEPDGDINRLFYKLPNLKYIRCNDRFFDKKDLIVTTEWSHFEEPNNLPFLGLPPEIWEKIFLYLKRNDQLKCRQICRFWFDLFSSSSKLYRTLDFSKFYISVTANPVQVFINTKFKYNRIVFDMYTNFAENEDLTEFWKQIGKGIEEIYVASGEFSLINAFKSGLTINHVPLLRSICFGCSHPLISLLVRSKIPECNSMLSQIKIIKIRGIGGLHGEQYTDFEIPNVEEFQIRHGFSSTLECLDHFSLPKITKLLIACYDTLNLNLLFNTRVNFMQLTCLSIGKRSKWTVHETNLVSEKCSNLKSLGMGLEVESYTYTLHREFEIKDAFFEKDWPNTVRHMFDKLSTLNDIYFIIFDSHVVRSKLFARTGINSFAVSDRFYPPFTNFFKEK